MAGSRSSSKLVTVIIPTYNHGDLLAECLQSFQNQTYRKFSVLVVDDGSQEDIPRIVESVFPAADVLRLDPNGGFARAVNAGIRAARTPLVMLLNNDMTLDPACIERLVHAMINLDMAAPLVLWRDNPELVYGCGDRQRRNGRPEAIGFRKPRAEFSPNEPIFGVSAGAGIYRREIFPRIGYFDERFVAYFEDSDLNFRAQLAGFHAGAVPEAVAYHVGSASIAGRTWWRARQCYRNHVLLVLKNFPDAMLLRCAPKIVLERLHQTIRLLSAARADLGLMRALGVWLKAWLEIWYLLPHALRERRRIQSEESIPNRDLWALLRR